MRASWDTSIKHLTRHGLLLDILTPQQLAQIPSSNISRWKQESNDKYIYSDLNNIISQEIDFIKRMNQSSKIKRINKAYFKLADTFHEIIGNIKGIKVALKHQKELLVNTIELVKEVIPINNALKIFDISRATYQNYKTIVIHKCEASYFKWCIKRFPNQLLPQEVETIKSYMTHADYMFWSKSSVYLKAVRDEALHCCLSTFYKYCRLLNFNTRRNKKKSDDYNPIKTMKPNELWCADVTIFKTADGTKHYIHFLIDHFSRMILDYRVENSNSGQAIRDLLKEATYKYKPEKLHLLTDGGTENVNNKVSGFLNALSIKTNHSIAQKDVVFSNSMVEALNKTIKHQFLYPKHLNSKTQLLKALTETVPIYNAVRPQMPLDGNTPFETFSGVPVNFAKYKVSFVQQKVIRLAQNKQNSCEMCF